MKYPHQAAEWRGEGLLVHQQTMMQLHFPDARHEPEGCSYLRVCDPDGDEVMYWSFEEWAEDPQLVIGAIMGLMCQHQIATEDRYPEVLESPL